jgi:hypothetical protein
MEVREPTPKITSSLDENIADENRCVDVTDDHIEIVKTTYENEIVKIHEYYQYVIVKFLIMLFLLFRTEIHRLTNLLISREMIDKDRSNTNTRYNKLINKSLLTIDFIGNEWNNKQNAKLLQNVNQHQCTEEIFQKM